MKEEARTPNITENDSDKGKVKEKRVPYSIDAEWRQYDESVKSNAIPESVMAKETPSQDQDSLAYVVVLRMIYAVVSTKWKDVYKMVNLPLACLLEWPYCIIKCELEVFNHSSLGIGRNREVQRFKACSKDN